MSEIQTTSGLHLGSLEQHPQMALLLGEFVVRWSLAEATLIMPMLIVLNSPSQEVAAAMLASTNSAEGKIKMVRTAVKHIKQPQHQGLKDPIDAALKLLSSLCDERNALSHHLWAFDQSDGAIVTIDYRKTGDPGRKTVRSEEYLRSLCNRTVEAAHAICAATKSNWVSAETVSRLKL